MWVWELYKFLHLMYLYRMINDSIKMIVLNDSIKNYGIYAETFNVI